MKGMLSYSSTVKRSMTSANVTTWYIHVPEQGTAMIWCYSNGDQRAPAVVIIMIGKTACWYVYVGISCAKKKILKKA